MIYKSQGKPCPDVSDDTQEIWALYSSSGCHFIWVVSLSLLHACFIACMFCCQMRCRPAAECAALGNERFSIVRPNFGDPSEETDSSYRSLVATTDANTLQQCTVVRAHFNFD
jgi:hypothetical protein